VPFTSLWGHDAVTDAWAGFASEKASLLEALHSVPNVIILSGDRHEFAAIEFNSIEERNPILEFSTSPLSMFYVPFIRTLRMRSDEVVRTVRTLNKPNIDGIEDTVATVEEIPRERVLKYIASGNYKW
jgi:alkaline phosphatase D